MIHVFFISFEDSIFLGTTRRLAMKLHWDSTLIYWHVINIMCLKYEDWSVLYLKMLQECVVQQLQQFPAWELLSAQSFIFSCCLTKAVTTAFFIHTHLIPDIFTKLPKLQHKYSNKQSPGWSTLLAYCR